MMYRFQSQGRVYQVSLRRGESGYLANLDGQTYNVEILDSQPGTLSLRFEGRPVRLYWASNGDQKWIALDGCSFTLTKPDLRADRQAGEDALQASVRAPMPAQVRGIEVSAGESVVLGQTLMILEAMKMEIRIKTPSAGLVKRVLVKSGESVDRDQLLVEIQKSAS